jgi:pyrroloquinoline quinone (PQQ) biosynthesis protein C
MFNSTLGDLKADLLHWVDSGGVAVENFPWEDKTAYGYWLAQTYYFVRHTTSFLGLTASRFGHWRRDLQYRQIHHLSGEGNHDLLLLNDLIALGMSLESFPELAETASLYQSQYYFIEHECPAAHYGYAYFLEGLAAKKIELFYDRLERTYSPEACNFLRVHMIEDRDHFEEGLSALDVLTQVEMDAFRRNMHQTAYLYIQMLAHIERIAVTGADTEAPEHPRGGR